MFEFPTVPDTEVMDRNSRRWRRLIYVVSGVFTMLLGPVVAYGILFDDGMSTRIAANQVLVSSMLGVGGTISIGGIITSAYERMRRRE